MIWRNLMQMVHVAFVKKQELTTEVDRRKLDPIQCELEGTVIAMQVVLQEVHAELEKHLAYFRPQGKNNMGNDIVHLQFKPVYKHDRIKLEAVMLPTTLSSLIVQHQICCLFASDCGFEQNGVEPKGDLERKMQSWVDIVRNIN